MLQSRDVALVGATDGVAAVEHHLVLHDDALVPQWVVEPLGFPERAVGPVRERAVLAPVPPGDDLCHLHQVLGEQSGPTHHVLEPHRRVLDADAAEGHRVEVGVQSAVVRAAQVEQHQRGAGVLHAPVVPDQFEEAAVVVAVLELAEEGDGALAQDAAEVAGRDVIEGDVDLFGHAAVRRGHQLLDGVEVVRRDRRPRPVALDHLDDALVLVVGVDAFQHPGRPDRPQDLVESVQVVDHRTLLARCH